MSGTKGESCGPTSTLASPRLRENKENRSKRAHAAQPSWLSLVRPILLISPIVARDINMGSSHKFATPTDEPNSSLAS
jgi:hypothetical protein